VSTPDPKPAKRIKDPRAVHDVVVKYARCQLCGRRGSVYRIGSKVYVMHVSGHHLVKKSQRGDDVPENILVVCGHGTDGCHGALERNDLHTQMLARAAMTEAQEEYVVRKKGWVYLERTYPRWQERPSPANISPRLPEWVKIDRSGWPPV